MLGTFKTSAQSCLLELKMQSEVLKQQKKSLEEQQQKFDLPSMKQSFTILITSVDSEIRSVETKKSLVEKILENSLKKRIAWLTYDFEWIQKVKRTPSNEANENGWLEEMITSIQPHTQDVIKI